MTKSILLMEIISCSEDSFCILSSAYIEYFTSMAISIRNVTHLEFEYVYLFLIKKDLDFSLDLDLWLTCNHEIIIEVCYSVPDAKSSSIGK